MEVLLFMIVGIVGVIIGYWLAYFTIKMDNRTSGTFVIDLTDPLKDVCRFEMEESLESIYSKQRITLNVKTYNDISSK